MSKRYEILDDLSLAVGIDFSFKRGERFIIHKSPASSSWRGRHVLTVYDKDNNIIESTAIIGRIHYWLWKYHEQVPTPKKKVELNALYNS